MDGVTVTDEQLSLPQDAVTASGRGRRSTARYVVLLLAITLTATIVLREVSHTPARILRVISGSMQPTLTVGQIVRLDASAYATVPPRVGDVVAFDAPAGATPDRPVCGVTQGAGEPCRQSTAARSDQIFIKRIVAAPGDTIAILGGLVVRNGLPERAPYTAACGGGNECNYPVVIQIPAGEFFLMGDDRGASDDSRQWGPVPQAWILGRVVR